MTSLRVVAAVAQHGTVSAAAAALNMTQSAATKQLKAIETTVGLELFRRGARGLSPTEAGAVYVEQARIAIGAMEQAAARVAHLRSDQPVVRLHVLPILGDRWLMPRIEDFALAHPGVELRHVTYQGAGEPYEADVVMRFGTGRWSDWRADYLIGRDVVLVASPGLLRRSGPIASIDDVARFSLFEHRSTPLFWSQLYEACGAPAPAGLRIASLGYYSLVLRSALSGQGLALAPRTLVQQELASGALVNPAGLRFESENCYWLTTRAGRERDGAVAAFCDWALEQARRSESEPAIPA